MLRMIVMKVMMVMDMDVLRRRGWDGRMAKSGTGYYKPRMGRETVLDTKTVVHRRLRS